MQRIINGYLYDTDNAILVWFDEAKGRSYYTTSNSRFFVVFATGEFQVCTTDFVKNLLGKYNIERYIEIFGTPKEG